MQPAMKAEDDESVRMNGIVCSRWINEDQTPIRNLDNTFVDHTSDYKTRLIREYQCNTTITKI
ncbi:hypothetical protein YC2023_082123 [Brassica napus]